MIALFPPGVHDIVVDPSNGVLSEVRCTGCAWSVPVHADQPDEIRWAKLAGYEHAAKHGRVLCHDECVDEPGCLYDGDEI